MKKKTIFISILFLIISLTSTIIAAEKFMSQEQLEKQIIEQYYKSEKFKNLNKNNEHSYQGGNVISQDSSQMEPESYEIPNFNGSVSVIPLD